MRKDSTMIAARLRLSGLSFDEISRVIEQPAPLVQQTLAALSKPTKKTFYWNLYLVLTSEFGTLNKASKGLLISNTALYRIFYRGQKPSQKFIGRIVQRYPEIPFAELFAETSMKGDL